MSTETRIPAFRCACGQENELATPVGETASDARPSPGSLTLCIGCGRCYQFGAELSERTEVEPKRLPGITPDLLAFLERAQCEIRVRRELHDKGISPEYVAACERAERAARGWLDQHRKEGPPRFAMPDRSIMLAAPLSELPRIADNAAAAKLCGYLLRREPELTVFMLRVVADRLGLAVRSVALSELGLRVGQS